MKIFFATPKQNEQIIDRRINEIAKGRLLQKISPAKGRDDLVCFELEIDNQMSFLGDLKRGLKGWSFKREIISLKIDGVAQNAKA